MRGGRGRPFTKGGARGHPFQKGQSGNPAGRPKGSADLKKLARTQTRDAVETLIALMRGAKSESIRMQSAAMLLDRGHGRPRPESDAPPSSPIDEDTAPEVVDAMIRRLRQEVEAELAPAAPAASQPEAKP